MIQQYWALTTWANRATATYVLIDRAINNITIDAYGRQSGTSLFQSGVPRRTVKVDGGTSTSYMMYDDDSNGVVPVIKITEA